MSTAGRPPLMGTSSLTGGPTVIDDVIITGRKLVTGVPPVSDAFFRLLLIHVFVVVGAARAVGRVVEVSSLVDLLDHGPRLELLDVNGCHAFHPISNIVRARLG
ncbi:hypothetical protein BRADI_3g21203v3 [Brachypodium distachyon]|uniref:Uncharacterized protein n=1 Tax=Brachypodium distachyon TaxID=15368 RepID=A0A2K2CYK6_BRADI|nr:hypothetical protein BRADI_3g21203v3 [Brachypodium distachyon]